MPVLPYLTADDLDEKDRDLLSHPLHIMQIMAYSPGLMRAMAKVGRYVRKDTAVPQRFVEIAILTVGWETQAPYEWSHHVKLAIAAGVTDSDFEAIKCRATATGPVSAIILAARQITQAHQPGKEIMDELQSHFAAGDVVDLVFFISLYNAIVRFLATFDIQPEGDYLQYLELHPLDQSPDRQRRALS